MAQAKHRKKYQVLGGSDLEDEEDAAAENAALRETGPEESLPSIHDVDPTNFPEDVWEAAESSPDEGRAVIQAFNELHTTRALCSQRLLKIREARALFTNKSAKASQLPPLTGTKYARNTTMLNSMNNKISTISTRIASTSDSRKLALYEQHANMWAEAVASLADRTQRMEADLAMQRGPEYRSKLELMEAISRALPVQDRGDGASVWAMSLRNAWERIVPLGNLLSGLFCIMHDFPSDYALQPQQRRALEDKLIKIGRPLDLPSGTGGFSQALKSTRGMEKPFLGRSLTSRGRDWQNSKVLQDRLKQHAGAMAKNGGYQPDMTGLKLEGHSVMDLALEAARMPVTLAEVQAHLMEANPEAYKVLEEAWEQAARCKESAAAMAAAAEQAALKAAQMDEEAAQKKLSQPGPCARVSTSGISLCTAAKGRDRASFELVHEGTAAVYYHWHCLPSQPHPFAPNAHTPQGSSPFCLARASGVLLPNETHTVEVDFVPQKPGMFHEVWQLMTTPQLLPPKSTPQPLDPQAPSPYSPQQQTSQSTNSTNTGTHNPQSSSLGQAQGPGHHQQQQRSDPDQSSRNHGSTNSLGSHLQGSTQAGTSQGACSGSVGLQCMLTVSVRGIATVEDQQVLARRALVKQLDQAEKESKVRQALEHILRCVDAPPPLPAPESPSQTAQALAWDSAQSEHWPPVYYPGPEVYAKLEAAYAEARAEVYRMREEAAELAEANTSKGRKGGKGGKGGKDKDVPTTPEALLPEFPEQWNGGLADLYAVLGELEGNLQASKAQVLEAQEAGTGGASKAAAAAAAEAAAAAVQAADRGIARVDELRANVTALEMSTQALAVPLDARMLMRHAMRAALGRVADAVEAKLAAVHADYEKRLAEQSMEGAAVVPGKEVGPQWLADKCRAGTKAQTRNLVPWLFEEVAREKAAIGDWLEARISDLDARIAAVEGGSPDPGPRDGVDAALEAAAHGVEAARLKAAAVEAEALSCKDASASQLPGSTLPPGMMESQGPESVGRPSTRLRSPKLQKAASRRNLPGSASSQRSVRSTESATSSAPHTRASAAEPQQPATEAADAEAPPATPAASPARAVSGESDARAVLERLYWIRFLRLRDWSQRDVPARGSIC